MERHNHKLAVRLYKVYKLYQDSVQVVQEVQVVQAYRHFEKQHFEDNFDIQTPKNTTKPQKREGRKNNDAHS